MKKWICILCLLGIILGLCACAEDSYTPPKLTVRTDGRQVSYTYSHTPSDQISLSEEAAGQLLELISGVQVEYVHSHLYDLEEVNRRLDFDATVDSHQYSVLDPSGKLDADYMAQLVKANNQVYLQENTFCTDVVDDDYLLEVCRFIVEVVQAMTEIYPDLDWDRVYCNLGNLKIIYDTGTLSYAQVSSDWVLSLSKTNTKIVNTLEGEDGFDRVLTHEIMHLIQIGCACEQIENCGRRCGISVYWDDFTLNTTDWGWLSEGAAERSMCMLTGGEAVTYQYKMDYLCSFNMAILLRESVKPTTMETLTFYSDPQLLFDAFGCEDQQDRDEVLNMMITTNVLQMQPNAFYIAYEESTGVDLDENAETMDQFSYSLKPAICSSLSKEFYENLVIFLQENPVELNDLFFLINIFESHLNQHLRYTAEGTEDVNGPFLDSYRAMRSALFAALQEQCPDIAQQYADYSISVRKGVLNGQLDMLPEEKRTFYAERAQWLDGLNGLGVKVPE